MPAVSPRDRPANLDESLQPSEVSSLASAQREVVDVHIFLERWMNAAMELNEESKQRLLLIVAEDFTQANPDGTTLYCEDWIRDFQSKWGQTRGKEQRLWTDRMHATEIGGGLWLVRCNVIQQCQGEAGITRDCYNEHGSRCIEFVGLEREFFKNECAVVTRTFARGPLTNVPKIREYQKFGSWIWSTIFPRTTHHGILFHILI